MTGVTEDRHQRGRHDRGDRGDRGLLARIEQAALDDATPVATALRLCLALGGQSGSVALRDWATRELQGYPHDADLPAYRVLPAMIMVDAALPLSYIHGQKISPTVLPDFVRERLGACDEVRLYQSIGEVEQLATAAMAQQQRVKVAFPDAPLVAQFLDRRAGQPGQHILDVYWQVSEHSVYGAADQVRTRLVALVAELVAAMPDGQDVPSPEQANQAVHVAINGGRRPSVNIVSAQAAEGGRSTVTVAPGEDDDDPKRRRRRVAGGLVALAGAVAGFGQWLNWKPPWR